MTDLDKKLEFPLDMFEEIIPKQESKEKEAFVAKINNISLYKHQKNEEMININPNEQYIMIDIENKTGRRGSFSTIILCMNDYKMILDSYKKVKQEDLIGKPIIAVYGQYRKLSGLIPLKMD